VYYVLKSENSDTSVWLTDVPEAITKQYQLKQGKSRREGWPDAVIFPYSRDKREGLELTDWIDNSKSWMIISTAFRKVLEGVPVPDVEYLPIQLQNHKKKITSTDYSIGNFTKLVEAVDREQSVFKEAGGDITRFDKLVLRPDVVRSGPPMFRMKERDILVLAREDLVKKLQNAGMTGVTFVETDKYKTFD
jgi:uncharacterized protein DUF1629